MTSDAERERVTERMASQCRSPRCTAERKGFRRELDSWRHRLIHCVGLESILEGLYGSRLRRDLSLFEDCEPEEQTDWSMDEKYCSFCNLRIDRISDHTSTVPSSQSTPTDSPSQGQQLLTEKTEYQAEKHLYSFFRKKDFPQNCHPPNIPVVAQELMKTMIQQFAMEYIAKSSQMEDTSTASATKPDKFCNGFQVNHAEKTFVREQDGPLDLTVTRTQQHCAGQDGVLDLSKKNSVSSVTSAPSDPSYLSTSFKMKISGLKPEDTAADAKGHDVSQKERTALNKVFSSLCPFHRQLLRSMLKFLMPSKNSAGLHCNKLACSSVSGNQLGCVKNNAVKTYYLRSHKAVNKDDSTPLESEACFPPTCTCLQEDLPCQSSGNGCIKMSVSKQNNTTYYLQRYTGLQQHYGDCPYAKSSIAFCPSEVYDQPDSINSYSRVCSPSPPPLSPVQSDSYEHCDESDTVFSAFESKIQEPATKLPPSLFPVDKFGSHEFHSNIYADDNYCQYEHEMQSFGKEFSRSTAHSKYNFEKDESSTLYQTAMERLNEKFKTIENTVKETDLTNCIKYESNQGESDSVRKLIALLCHAKGNDYSFMELLQQHEKKTEKKIIQTRLRKRQENLFLNYSDPTHLRWKTLQLKRDLANLNHTFAEERFVQEHARKKSLPENVNELCNNSKAVDLLNTKCLISVDGTDSSLGSLALHEMRTKDIHFQRESMQLSGFSKNGSFSETGESVILQGFSDPLIKSNREECFERPWKNVTKNETVKCKYRLHPLKRVDTCALSNRAKRNIVPPERFSLYITEPRQMYSNAYLTKKCFQQRSPKGAFCLEESQNKLEENLYCRDSASVEELAHGHKGETTVSENSCLKVLMHVEPLKNMLDNTVGHTAAGRFSGKHLYSEECNMNSSSEEADGIYKQKEKNMKNTSLHTSSGVSEKHILSTAPVLPCSFEQKIDSLVDTEADRKTYDIKSRKTDAEVNIGTVAHRCSDRVLRSHSTASKKYCRGPLSGNCNSIEYGHYEHETRSELEENDSVTTYNSPVKLMFFSEVNSSDGVKYTLKSFSNCSDVTSQSCTSETPANVCPLTEVNDNLQVPTEFTLPEKSPEKFIQTCTVSCTTEEKSSSSDCTSVAHGNSVIMLKEMATGFLKGINESDLKRKPGWPRKIGPRVEKQVKQIIDRSPKPKMDETEGTDSRFSTTDTKDLTPSCQSEVVDEDSRNITVTVTYRRSRRIKRLESKHLNCTLPMESSNLITKSPEVALNVAASRFNLQNMKHHAQGVSSEKQLEQCSYNSVRPVKVNTVLPHQICNSSVCPNVKTSLALGKQERPAKLRITGKSESVDARTPQELNVRINRKLQPSEKDALMLERKMIADTKHIQQCTVADKLEFLKNNAEAHHSEQINCGRMKKHALPLRQSTRIKNPSLQFLHSVASTSSFTRSSTSAHKSCRVLVNKADILLQRSNLISKAETSKDMSETVKEGNSQLNISDTPKEISDAPKEISGKESLANSVYSQTQTAKLNQVLKLSENPFMKSDTSVKWWPNSSSFETLVNRLNNRFEQITNSWIPVNVLQSGSSIYEEKKNVHPNCTLAESAPFSYHLLEVTVTPVKMLFQTKYDMNKLCAWFMQTTETHSLPIKRKENARSPLKTASTKGIKIRNKQVDADPIPQAERLKKHLKKFALASPARAAGQIQVQNNMLQSKVMKFRRRSAAKMKHAKLWKFCHEEFLQNRNISCKTVTASYNPIRRNLRFESQSHSSKTEKEKQSCMSQKPNCSKAETVLTLFSNEGKSQDMVHQEEIAIPFVKKNTSLTAVSEEGMVNKIPRSILKGSEKCSDQVDSVQRNYKSRNFKECRVFLRKMSTVDEKNYQLDLVQKMLGPLENNQKSSSDKSYVLRSQTLRTAVRKNVLVTQSKDAVGNSITKRRLLTVLPKIVLRSFRKQDEHVGIPKLTVRSTFRKSEESNAVSSEVPALVNERKRQRPHWGDKDLNAKKQKRQSYVGELKTNSDSDIKLACYR